MYRHARRKLTLATDARSVFDRDALIKALLAACSGCEKRHSLQKVGALDAFQNLMLLESLEPSIPILAQVVFIGGVGRREQLEHSQRDAACVNLLEDLADSLLGRLLPQEDEWNLVLLEALDHCANQLVPAIEALLEVSRVACRYFICQFISPAVSKTKGRGKSSAAHSFSVVE